ncbi:hypothetical protein BDN71DRAFT_1429872 [Pleurotus eryngii]|uniref:Uncharacterized protein n=1 Tax=Pleurotus eryngii TaxID=5323 RepID=A0A9P6DGL4_PLEER|nr:hypothetical protein BDN71DRAFT_1429872 [Pleurotus eryngii]
MSGGTGERGSKYNIFTGNMVLKDGVASLRPIIEVESYAEWENVPPPPPPPSLHHHTNFDMHAQGVHTCNSVYCAQPPSTLSALTEPPMGVHEVGTENQPSENASDFIQVMPKMSPRHMARDLPLLAWRAERDLFVQEFL